MSETNSLSGLLSVNGPSFDLLGACDFSDMVFMDLVLYLNNTDKALASKMKELRALEKQKEQLNLKLERLNDALASSSAKDPDDLVYVNGGLEKPKDKNDCRQPLSAEKRHDLEKDWKDCKLTLNEVTNKNIGPWGEITTAINSEDGLKRMNLFRKKEVEAEIEKTRNQMEQLNSSTQIFMIDMQRLLNQRNQAVEFTTNTVAKEERTARSIIENLKA